MRGYNLGGKGQQIIRIRWVSHTCVSLDEEDLRLYMQVFFIAQQGVQEENWKSA
jgi:hypothetical protein